MHASVLLSADQNGIFKEALAVHGLGYACGGSDTGGQEATRLLEASFAHLDASVLALTGAYKSAERIVLFREGSVVAAAVVQLHVEHSAMEVPIFAAAKACRRQGHGSLLTALLTAMGRSLGLRTLLISATDESRAFWLKQGLHTLNFCAPRAKVAVRALKRASRLLTFANSHLMAMPCAEDGADGADGEAAEPADVLRVAIERLGSERAAGLSWRKAAAALGYVDVHATGSFWRMADGTHAPIALQAHEQLPAAFEVRLPSPHASPPPLATHPPRTCRAPAARPPYLRPTLRCAR